MTDLEFVNHPMLAFANRTMAYAKPVKPLSYDWITVKDESFYMTVVEEKLFRAPSFNEDGTLKVRGLSGLINEFEHSRFPPPKGTYWWPHSLDSFDPMI